jgi:serine/threonine protein phosphatase PrpC
VNLRSSALTDIGRVRPENEDSNLCDDQIRLYAVADGIGGLPAGADASRTAITALIDWFSRQQAAGPYDYTAGLTEINEKVFLLGRVLSPRLGIGTTLTIAHFDTDHVVVIHVGDTSMYRLRDRQLEALTLEHNVENEMRQRAARGEPAMLLTENRQALTRCVGQPPPLEGDIHAHPVHRGDRYLICSDGVTRYVLPAEVERLLSAAATPSDICRALVDLSNERGGVDNSTAVAIFLD